MKRVISSIVVAGVVMSMIIPFVSANETIQPTSTPVNTETNRPQPLFKRLKEDRWQIIQNFYHAMREKFENASSKMSGIADRMQQKADEFQAKGFDTAKIEKSIADAKAKIADAKSLIVKATEQFKAIQNATDRKAAFATFRETVNQIRQSLRATHGLLKEAVQGLREISKNIKAGNEQKS